MVDYWDEAAFGPFVSDSDRLPRDVIQVLTDAFMVTIRPSGTEPKLKFYCQLLPNGGEPAGSGHDLLAAVRARADAAARQVYADLLARIGASLDTAGLMLPDIVDLDRKLAFQTTTVPALRSALASGRFGRLDALLAWLRGEIAAMTPGTDPLPAAKGSIAHLAERWRAELPDAAAARRAVGVGALVSAGPALARRGRAAGRARDPPRELGCRATARPLACSPRSL